MNYKIYLAGPDVFKQNAKEYGKSLVNMLKHWNFEGIFPLENEVNLTKDKIENGRKIALSNMNSIKKCDAVLANLESFRGPSADIGTVWECAYAKGLGKVVWGYNIPLNEFKNFAEYKSKVFGKIPHDGMLIEDFGVWDNIMLVHGINGANYEFVEALEALKLYLQKTK